jgi:hypothetical protein
MKSPARFLLLAVFLALVAVGCSRDSGEGTTTSLDSVTTTSFAPASSSSSPSTTAPATTVASTAPASSTSTNPGQIPEPEWTISQRTEGDDGATVVVLLDPESYERITDIDLQNIIEDVIEMFPPIYEVHIVDSQEAADVVVSEVIDTDDQAILGAHYFARLEEGFRIVFVGPFEDFGITILGS